MSTKSPPSDAPQPSVDISATSPSGAFTEATAQEALHRVTQHRAEGRMQEALDLIDTLSATYGPRPILIGQRGGTLYDMGRKDAGIAELRRALDMAPKEPTLAADLGAVLAREGQFDEALAHFQDAAEAAPKYAIARSNLGALLLAQKNYRPAIEHLKAALDLEPRFVDAATNLAIAQNAVNRPNEAADALYRALSVQPNEPGLHLELATSLFRAERHDTALYHVGKALDLAPGMGKALLLRGRILTAQGQMQEASQSILQAARQPGLALPAMTQLIHMRKTKPGAPELALLEKALAHRDPWSDAQNATLDMAAAKAYDDLGAYDRAFDHLVAGNALTARMHPYDPDLAHDRATRMIAFCNADMVSDHGPTGGLNGVQPVFISGLPRSGTTLVEQMLSGHDAIEPGGELGATMRALGHQPRLHAALEERLDSADLTPDDYTKLGENYIAAVREAGVRTNCFTDKMPGNYQFLGLMALALPQARFVLMRRHPMDVILSNFMQDFGRNQPAATDLTHLARAYQDFDMLAKHWTALLPDQVIEVQYEDVVADPETQIRRILTLTGHDYQPAVLDHTNAKRPVMTASVAQVRQPLYSHAVERWKRYEKQLAPIADMLGIAHG